MATPTQVYAALTIENTFHILYPTAPKNYSQFSDITDWAGLGYSTGAGDVVKGIFKVIDPSGQVAYENAGYASNDFSSPDWDLTSLTAPQFNLLTYTGTDTPIYGDYQFLWKVQVTPNGLNAFQVDKGFIVGLSEGLSPVLSLEDTYDCNSATFKSVDTTIYGAPVGYTIQSITKTHVTRPPLVSKKSDGVTAQPTVTSSSTTNLLAATNNPLWTGAYSSSIAAIILYKSGNNYTYVNCPAVELDTEVTCDNSLCKLFCILKKLYTQYFTYLAAGNTVLANIELAKWQKASDIFILIWKAQTCSTGDVDLLTKKFYDVTGLSPDCDCGCSGDEPAPVIPTTSINGQDGTDGLTAEFRVTGTLFQWKYTTDIGWNTLFDFSTIAGLNGTSFLQGSGVPSNGLGENGDSYLDIDTDDIYLKTAGSWAVTANIKGGSGLAILNNNIGDSATTGTTWQSLKSYTIPANTIVTTGDVVEIKARFKASGTIQGQQWRIQVGGSTLASGSFNNTTDFADVVVTFSRNSSNSAKYYAQIQVAQSAFSLHFVTGSLITQIQSYGGLNYGATLAVSADGLSIVTGDVICEELLVTYLHKQ